MQGDLVVRYWIELDTSEAMFLSGFGYGVTAYDYEDALGLLREHLSSFYEKPIALPPVVSVIEDVDVSTLDERHVLPNMGVTVWRGIWYPWVTRTGSERP